MAEKFQVLGLREFENTLRQLGPDIARKAIRSALMAAAKPIKEEARARAPTLSEPSKWRRPNAIKVHVIAYMKTRDTVYIRVRNRGDPGRARAEGKRLRRGQTSPDNPWYWWRVEFGTPAHGIPARPFMRGAFAAKKGEAIEQFKKLIRGNIKRVLKKLVKPPAK